MIALNPHSNPYDGSCYLCSAGGKTRGLAHASQVPWTTGTSPALVSLREHLLHPAQVGLRLRILLPHPQMLGLRVNTTTPCCIIESRQLMHQIIMER